MHGEGPRLTVLLHGLLFNQRMHESLARALAARGNRVVTLDLLGHGDSDRPADKWRYSMPAFGRQVVALLDHLDEPEAVVLGTSLGANVALEVAAAAPERLRGMVIEMPVLDHALIGCAIAFTPIMVALTAGEPAMRLRSRAARLVPAPAAAVAGRHPARLGPPGAAPSAAVFEGLFFGRIAPPRALRRGMRTPALVIGHQYDFDPPLLGRGCWRPSCPARGLLEATSLIELRVAPKRLTNEIAAFVDTVGSRGRQVRDYARRNYTNSR